MPLVNYPLFRGFYFCCDALVLSNYNYLRASIILETMGKNVIMSNEGAMQFSHALEMLNSSIKELAQIADSLIPENLIRDGIVAYLKDFCITLENDCRIKTNFNSEIEGFSFSEEIEIMLYRNFKAMIGIILKHVQCSDLTIRLICKGNLLQIIAQVTGETTTPLLANNLLNEEIELLQLNLKKVNGSFQIKPVKEKGYEFDITFQI